MRRMKFLEMGFGIRLKAQKARAFVDKRRLDGTRTKAGDFLLKHLSEFLYSIADHRRTLVRGKNLNTSKFSKETILAERKKLGKNQ